MMIDAETMTTSTRIDEPAHSKVRAVDSHKGDHVKDVGEDDLQFPLDDCEEDNRETDPKSKQQNTDSQAQTNTTRTSTRASRSQFPLSPVKEQENVSTTSLPWLERRARFYPAPILPNKPPKSDKVSF